MRKQVQIAGMAVLAAAGIGTGVALGTGGDDGVRACAVAKSGQIVATREQKCGPGEFAITISGDAFKPSSRGGTLTINGVSFKRGSGKTITINGTAFKKGSGKTITINGTAFKRGSGGTITINGVAFKKGSGKTITINGTEFDPSTANQPGPPGPMGPVGPAGVGAAGTGAVEVSGPLDATAGGSAVTLASSPLTITDGTSHLVFVAGGFDASCVDPCPSAAQGVYDIRRNAVTSAFTRRLPVFSAGGITGMSGAFSEVIDAPATCAPCTFSLRLQAVGSAAASGPSTIRVTAIRLAVVDLGPAKEG